MSRYRHRTTNELRGSIGELRAKIEADPNNALVDEFWQWEIAAMEGELKRRGFGASLPIEFRAGVVVATAGAVALLVMVLAIYWTS